MSFTPLVFNIDDTDRWKKYLKDKGFVVIKNILTSDEITTGKDLFKKDWNTVSPKFDFENKGTWGIDNTPIMYGKGIAVFNGFGQSDFMWYLRLNNNIQNIFEKIYETNELVVSFDGFSVFLSEKQKSKSWLHIDENPNNPLYCIQGSYNFMPVTEHDAGFLVVPKSHLNYKPNISHNKDWIMCEDKDYLQKSQKLLIPENCFTLWNSRTIHANTGMKKKDLELNRLTAYISYLPKNVRSNKIYEKRLDAYKNSHTTSHWANKCEIKKYPWGFGPTYKKRGYKNIEPSLYKDDIPPDRLEFI